jgi:hypothetical protein
VAHIFIIGTSLGDAAVVWAAAERPEGAHSLTLIIPFARAAKINPVMNALLWLGIRTFQCSELVARL